VVVGQIKKKIFKHPRWELPNSKQKTAARKDEIPATEIAPLLENAFVKLGAIWLQAVTTVGN